MKFGRKINADLYGEWRTSYLDYNRIKKFLKVRTTNRNWNADDENEFVHMLKDELEKIYKFLRRKIRELSAQIAAAEARVQSLVQEEEEERRHRELSPPEEHPPPQDLENQQDDPEAGYPGDSDGDDDDVSHDEGRHSSVGSLSIEDQFRALEEDVATLVADVHDLALYTKLNFTGFIKIVKKHDKRTSLSLKTTFVQDFLDRRPFHKYNWDALIIKLSKLYNLVRTRGHPVEGDASAGGSQNAFVRQTTKYWVHPDNLVHLKLSILRQLPVLVFNPNKEFEIKDTAITSIYFDNEDLDLYLGRLEKTEGAEAIRLRWYGGMENEQIFVERKTHREDWTGEKSVKARFPIQESKVNAFLAGEYTMDAEFDRLVTRGKKSASEVESMKQLANEVQYAILTRKLKPVLRTFYNRTAFQLPGDARVRISLDTELTMVREDNWDGRIRSGDNWRRMDMGIDYPFNQLPPEDVERFQHGVLEVKLMTQVGQEPPPWVIELVNSHLVEAVPKFSKFIHGCSTLLPERVDLVPFWLPQMDVDIHKPDLGAMHIDRPSNQSSQRDSQEHSGHDTPKRNEQPDYTEPLSEGEEDEEMFPVDRDEDKHVGLTPEQAVAIINLRKQELKAKEIELGSSPPDYPSQKVRSSEPDPRPRGFSIDPLAPSAAFDAQLRSKLKVMKDRAEEQAADDDDDEDEDHPEATNGQSQPRPDSDERILVREWHAPPGKRVAIPVRVEPKVYFASERTFLMWLQFAVLINGIPMTLVNFTKPGDVAGETAASAFTACALLSILYAIIIYVNRARSLRTHSADGIYHDRFGTTILALLLIGTILMNVIMRLSEL